VNFLSDSETGNGGRDVKYPALSLQRTQGQGRGSPNQDLFGKDGPASLRRGLKPRPFIANHSGRRITTYVHSHFEPRRGSHQKVKRPPIVGAQLLLEL
jgi:hypothetical protein